MYVLDMWRAAFLAPLVLAVSACGGGGGTPLAKTARPCLEKLGQYVHHHPEKGPVPSDRTPRLPLPDPDNRPVFGQAPVRLPWPKDFQEYGEVLYPPTNPGANAVQVLIFGDEKLPARIMDAVREASRAQTGTPTSTSFATPPGTKLVRIGQSIVLWSSTPSPRQRTTVRGCLT
jgi:hypothetical protein